MLDPDLLDRLLPVATLLLGAGIARTGKRGDAKRVAAEQLADLRRVVWNKGGLNDWLDLQVFLGRLSVALRSAGVPQTVVSHLVSEAESFWEALEESGDAEVGLVVDATQMEALKDAESRVLDWLDRPWHVVRRWRALRGVPADE